MEVDPDASFLAAAASFVTAIVSLVGAFKANADAKTATTNADAAGAKATQAEVKALDAEKKAGEVMARLKQTEILLPVHAEYSKIRELDPDDPRWEDHLLAPRLVEQVRTNLNAMELMATFYLTANAIPGDMVESMYSHDYRTRLVEIRRIVAAQPYRLGPIAKPDAIWSRYHMVEKLYDTFKQRADDADRDRINKAKDDQS